MFWNFLILFLIFASSLFFLYARNNFGVVTSYLSFVAAGDRQLLLQLLEKAKNIDEVRFS